MEDASPSPRHAPRSRRSCARGLPMRGVPDRTRGIDVTTCDAHRRSATPRRCSRSTSARRLARRRVRGRATHGQVVRPMARSTPARRPQTNCVRSASFGPSRRGVPDMSNPRSFRSGRTATSTMARTLDAGPSALSRRSDQVSRARVVVGDGDVAPGNVCQAALA